MRSIRDGGREQLTSQLRFDLVGLQKAYRDKIRCLQIGALASQKLG